MIDLHVHTVNSDGDFTTEEILQEAIDKNIEILSISDHHNVTAYDELKELSIRDRFNGRIVTGVELEFAKDGRLYDMLGYDFDPEIIKKAKIIQDGTLHATIEGQTKILNKLKEVCDSLGIKYSDNLVIKSANHMANDVIVDDILTYLENKEILDNMKITDRSSFYRLHCCEPKSPFYIITTDDKYDVFYVADVIHKAGGKTFLAHPFIYRLPNLKEVLDDLVSLGVLDGIECEHRKHTEDNIKWIKEYCNKHHLLKSGGSDKHTNKHEMGFANNNQKPITRDLVEDWLGDI